MDAKITFNVVKRKEGEPKPGFVFEYKTKSEDSAVFHEAQWGTIKFEMFPKRLPRKLKKRLKNES